MEVKDGSWGARLYQDDLVKVSKGKSCLTLIIIYSTIEKE